MADFTAGGIHALPSKPRSIGDPEFDKRIQALVQDWGCNNSCDLVQEMVVTALKMGRENISVADMKLFNRALRELRYAARVFAPYAAYKKVVVFGSARTPPGEPTFVAAEEFARKMVERDYMIITGGGDGIMGAAQRGAGREHSFGLNIRLPFEQRANEVIHGDAKLINFNYFFTRKLNFVKETHAVALFPGGFGTMDEGFEVLTLMQTGKGRILPLVLIDSPGGNYWRTWFAFLSEYLLKLGLVGETDFNFFTMTDSVDEAIAVISQFYKNFVSYRWVGKKMVIRMNRPLPPGAVEKMSGDFADILLQPRIEQGPALPEEKNEPELASLPRLILIPDQRQYGRIRRLIDAVNTLSD
ncbi:MAG TPA: LOG family protein [Chthoniobacteraceae bacterium]|nr:LOG family protein [Chthoniobacteraceae bacterium]